MVDVRKATAYHEAGHAVVALVLGSKIKSVDIGERPLAACLHPTKINAAITALCGDLAERRGCPGSDWNADVDFEVACDIAERLAPGAPLKMLKEFLGRAQTLLDAHWADVETIADALMERGRLSGSEIDRLVRR